MNLNSYQINNFFNFFLLLFFLNSFLLIDPELIIFFSISFVIILFTNNLSELTLKFFNINFINYYYNYIKYFNIQLYNLYELSKFLNLNLFIYNFPFYLEYFNNFNIFINNFFVLNFKNWIILLEFNFFKLIKQMKIRLFKYFFNYYFFLIDQIYYLFPIINYNNGELLLDYYFQNNTFKINNTFNSLNFYNNLSKKFIANSVVITKNNFENVLSTIFSFSFKKNFKSYIENHKNPKSIKRLYNRFYKNAKTSKFTISLNKVLDKFFIEIIKPQQPLSFFQKTKESIANLIARLPRF